MNNVMQGLIEKGKDRFFNQFVFFVERGFGLGSQYRQVVYGRNEGIEFALFRDARACPGAVNSEDYWHHAYSGEVPRTAENGREDIPGGRGMVERGEACLYNYGIEVSQGEIRLAGTIEVIHPQKYVEGDDFEYGVDFRDFGLWMSSRDAILGLEAKLKQQNPGLLVSEVLGHSTTGLITDLNVRMDGFISRLAERRAISGF